MWKKLISYLIIPSIIVTIVAYIWILNPESVVVKYQTNSSTSGPLGLVLIITFILGAAISALFAFCLGLLHLFREWRAAQRRKTHDSHQTVMIEAREHLVAGNFQHARALFSKIISSNPENIIARVLLAETLKQEGNTKAALDVLDKARSEHQTNVELLFLAAEINGLLGNQTAACDNLAIVLKSQPNNIFALAHLVEYCRALGRFEDAIDYQKRLIKFTPAVDQAKRQEELASLELLAASELIETDAVAYKKELENLLRRHREFPPALAELARVERELGNLDASSKLLSKAYQLAKDSVYLEDLAGSWLRAENPERAIANVKQAVNGHSKESQENLEGQFFLINLLMHLEAVEDAEQLLKKVKNNIPADSYYEDLAKYFEATILQKQGKSSQASQMLLEVIERVYHLPGEDLFNKSSSTDRSPKRIEWLRNSNGNEAPPARLSTP